MNPPDPKVGAVNALRVTLAALLLNACAMAPQAPEPGSEFFEPSPGSPPASIGAARSTPAPAFPTERQVIKDRPREVLAPDRTGSPGSRVLLTDYGISVQPDSLETRWTQTSVLVGTAGYLAPERATGGPGRAGCWRASRPGA